MTKLDKGRERGGGWETVFRGLGGQFFFPKITIKLFEEIENCTFFLPAEYSFFF